MSAISGPVFRPGDDGYDAERTGFNLAVEHHPELVVGATGPGDVVAAVESASASGLAVAVLATGHGVSVPADGALMINTHRMNGVRVDPTTRSARVDAGARWAEVVPETATYGLAPLSGSSPNVGAVGYTLGGGIGMLGREYGFAADHVRQFQVVTADGRLRHVSAEEYPDLFWGLRGSKGNFGVVVSMEIDLVPVARLLGGGLYFGGEATADVLHTYIEWTRTVPEQMGSSVLMIQYPDDPQVPGPLRGQFVNHVRIAWSGPPEEGQRWVQPLREVAPRLLDTVAEMPYSEVGSIHNDPTEPVAAYDHGAMLRGLDAAAADTIVSLAGPEAGAPFVVELRHLGGAFARPPSVPNAVGGRDADFTLFAASIMEPDRTEEIRLAHHLLYQRMGPWSTGGLSMNFLGVGDADPGRVRRAFAPADYTRLAELKTTYDPGNLFRINHNIPPLAR